MDRRNFLKSFTMVLPTSRVAATLISMLLLLGVVTGCGTNKHTPQIVLDQQNPTCRTAVYGVTLNSDLPIFDSLWIDSLGKGRHWHNVMAVEE